MMKARSRTSVGFCRRSWRAYRAASTDQLHLQINCFCINCFCKKNAFASIAFANQLLLQTQLKGLQSSINRSIAFADQLHLQINCFCINCFCEKKAFASIAFANQLLLQTQLKGLQGIINRSTAFVWQLLLHQLLLHQLLLQIYCFCRRSWRAYRASSTDQLHLQINSFCINCFCKTIAFASIAFAYQLHLQTQLKGLQAASTKN